MKKVKYALQDWFEESKFLDWVEAKLVYSRFKITSKIGIMFWGFRRHL